MTDLTQCEECRRYHSAGAVQAVPFAVALAAVREGRLALAPCGLPDCASLKAALVAGERAAVRRAPRALRRAVAATPSAPPAARRGSGIDRSCPPEAADAAGLDHRAEQRRFVADGDGDSDCEKMLELLFGSGATAFRVDDAARVSRGPWISSRAFRYEHGIPTPNSRASQLRGCETIPAHPLCRTHRLDVDTRCVAGDWEYSLCFAEHSLRLARERKKAAAAGQRSFLAD